MTDAQRDALTTIIAVGEPILHRGTGPGFGWSCGDVKLNTNTMDALQTRGWIEKTKEAAGQYYESEHALTDLGRELVPPMAVCAYEDAALGCTRDHGHKGQHRMGRITSV